MADCGTYAGYQQHKRQVTVPCEPCRAANRAAHSRWRATKGPAQARERLYDKAAERARRQLAQLHKYEYAQLLTEQLASLEGR